MRILAVEDDEVLGEAICQRFTKMGQGIDLVTSGDLANSLLKRHEYDLILLDLNLPNLNGEQILKKLRARSSNTPVLILTARAQVEHRIELLDLGADDYLTKPFDFGELEARCRALLRRNQGLGKDNLDFDRKSCTVTIAKELIDLKQREFRLLEIFLTHQGKVLNKDELLEHLYSFDDSPSPNAIETYVARLRKKLVNSSVDIKTLRGLGYLLAEPNE